MIVRSAEFIGSGLNPSHFPKNALPEIAFAGRSNVGKSSLINALLRRKSLVRTSRRPGQTRTLNFFLINDDFLLVDLPGYGFSRAPKEVIDRYQEATLTYLKKRKKINLVVLLLDIRRSPSQEDKAFFHSIRSYSRDVIIVLTKSDTVGRGYWGKNWLEISKKLDSITEKPVFFSAKSGQGREELWTKIESRLQV